jgi:hypothetical protein
MSAQILDRIIEQALEWIVSFVYDPFHPVVPTLLIHYGPHPPKNEADEPMFRIYEVFGEGGL